MSAATRERTCTTCARRAADLTVAREDLRGVARRAALRTTTRLLAQVATAKQGVADARRAAAEHAGEHGAGKAAEL